MYELAKRVFDIVLSLLMLVFFVPLFILAALLIKLTSHGPIFYRQTRVGKNGRLFSITRFRTMEYPVDKAEFKSFVGEILSRKIDVEKQNVNLFLKMDPRITTVGKFLRETRLDELPQLVNVLKGDMSLVGPRPLMSYEVDRFKEWLEERIKCKPGMTGLSHIYGENVKTFKEAIEVDVEYMKRRSILLDIKILGRAFVLVMTQKGAF
jgi:lipopolysaccharide/colanic/teichoic acid biosynthesis glycosyltransferase